MLSQQHHELAAMARLREQVLAVAQSHADAVDREGRFPTETFAALKSARLLGVMIPQQFGGEGLSIKQVADLCAALGQVCASSALIYAMHHIKTSSLVFHGPGSVWHEAFMSRVAAEQLLLGSATTEGGIGGDLRNSLCAVERDLSGATFVLRKEAIVVSYGEQADAILVTARKDGAAPSSDQVLVVGERAQTELIKTGGWDAFGMRGTGSDGFVLTIKAPVEQIFPLPFADIAAQSMLAHTHILWSAVWYGIASEAVQRAQSLVRAESRRRAAAALPGNTITPGNTRLAELLKELQLMRGLILSGIERLEQAHLDPSLLESAGFLIEMNTLKISASEAVVAILNRAMLVCGIHGYRNDTPYSLGRLMRDAQSAPIMINNDRILANTANMVLMNRVSKQLSG
jgi:acyl-CoA dehydrogenase